MIRWFGPGLHSQSDFRRRRDSMVMARHLRGGESVGGPRPSKHRPARQSDWHAHVARGNVPSLQVLRLRGIVVAAARTSDLFATHEIVGDEAPSTRVLTTNPSSTLLMPNSVPCSGLRTVQFGLARSRLGIGRAGWCRETLSEPMSGSCCRHQPTRPVPVRRSPPRWCGHPSCPGRTSWTGRH